MYFTNTAFPPVQPSLNYISLQLVIVVFLFDPILFSDQDASNIDFLNNIHSNCNYEKTFPMV